MRRRAGRPRRVLVVAALALPLLLAGCASQGLQTPSFDDGHGTTVWNGGTGEPVDFSGPTEDGSTFRSTAERGKVLVVNFWYNDCPPCNGEAPVLASVAKQYAGKGVQFVGIDTQDGRAQAEAFQRRYGTTYPSILDQSNSGAAQLAFQKTVPPAAIPTTLVIDKQGKVMARLVGEIDSGDRSTLTSLIDQARTGKA